jgi:hypothetical protein
MPPRARVVGEAMEAEYEQPGTLLDRVEGKGGSFDGPFGSCAGMLALSGAKNLGVCHLLLRCPRSSPALSAVLRARLVKRSR